MKLIKLLYERTARALPGITTREFSRYCGKSEGYYGSISSQNLEVSTNSLIYLAEVLDYKNSITPKKELKEVMEIIANEVARRTQDVACGNYRVRSMVLKAVARAYMQREDAYYAPAIVIG